MKKITCVEAVRSGDIVFVSPFDTVPAGAVSSIKELEKCLGSTTAATRLWFIVNIKLPDCEFHIGKMDWKWDEEYYEQFDSSKSRKGTQ
jgi:hypothetical protein